MLVQKIIEKKNKIIFDESSINEERKVNQGLISIFNKKILNDPDFIKVQIQSNKSHILREENLDIILPLVLSTKIKDVDPSNIRKDISSSMNGKKLNFAIDSIKFLIKKLSQFDRVSLVTFSGDSEIIFPLIEINEKNQNKIIECLDRIEAEGSTNIKEGFEKVFDLIESMKFNQQITQLVFLTDGEDTYGNSKEDIINFIEKKINIFDTKIGISCFGYGNDYDEELLEKISKKFDGDFYFIDNYDILYQCLTDQLGKFYSIIAFNCEIQFTLQKGIKIKQILSDNIKKDGCNDYYNINNKFMFVGYRNDYVFEIQINQNILENKNLLKIIDIKLLGNSIYGQKFEISQSLNMQFTNEQNIIKENIETNEIYKRIKVCKELESAKEEEIYQKISLFENFINPKVKTENTFGKKHNYRKIKQQVRSMQQQQYMPGYNNYFGRNCVQELLFNQLFLKNNIQKN